VEVRNPDGSDTFTGTEQPFFLYPELLQPYERTAAKRWEWTVPASVGSFAFQVYVSAPLPNEAGVLKFTQLRGDFAARSLYSMWGTGPGEVWVGGKSTLLYYTGSRWALLPLQTNEGITALHGTGSGDVWAVGSNGFVQHFDGRRWSAVNTGVLESWTAVFAASPTDVVVAGGAYGKVMRWNGAAWTVLDAGNAGRRFSSAWGTGPNDVYLFGGQWNTTSKSYDGLVRHWDGTQWTDTLLPGTSLGAVWASSPGDIWVLGSVGQRPRRRVRGGRRLPRRGGRPERRRGHGDALERLRLERGADRGHRHGACVMGNLGQQRARGGRRRLGAALRRHAVAEAHRRHHPRAAHRRLRAGRHRAVGHRVRRGRAAQRGRRELER